MRFGFPRTTVLDGVLYRTKMCQWRGAHIERRRFIKIGIMFFTEQTQRELSLRRTIKNKP
jgi:hypothetical protein